MEYQRILKQRNALLRRLKASERAGDLGHLDAWDESLMKPALLVMAARSDFIDEIAPRVAEFVIKLGATDEKVEVKYQPRKPLVNFEDLKAAVSAFRKERTRDLRLGSTFLGPHRDVIEITIGEVPLRSFGSMGQKKTVMIAMKLAALQVLSEHRGEPAILVLDEAFAELDRESRAGPFRLAFRCGTGIFSQRNHGGTRH